MNKHRITINTQRIQNGIESYQHEQKVILRVLRMKNGMTANEFDTFFSNKLIRRIRFYNMTSQSFILGGMRFGNLAKWLELTQLMSVLGLVEVSTDKLGNISYALPTSKDIS